MSAQRLVHQPVFWVGAIGSLLLIVGKATGWTTAPWLWVLLPLWGPVALPLALGCLGIAWVMAR